MNSGWKKYWQYAAVVVLGLFLVQLMLVGYSKAWTGFGAYTLPTGEVIREKTLWDWMELLIIPLFLTGGALLLNRSERNNEREIATDRQREAAFQAYLDHMGELLLKDKLRTSKKAEVRDMARTRTLTILRGLDTRRKGLVIIFLKEAGLINATKPIVTLHNADLTGVDLKSADLTGINLNGANLERANLMEAFLTDAYLQDVNLQSAKLYDAVLIDANLQSANLNKADLNQTNFRGANLWGAELIDVKLHEADFEGASLKFVHFERAYMKGATLGGANLEYANLRGANVEGADFEGTNLHLAIMPDGTTHD
jgi:uncharacterized protein YjbI with pentapeptide repeats